MKNNFLCKIIIVLCMLAMALALMPETVRTVQALGIEKGLDISIDTVVGYCGHRWVVIGYNNGVTARGVYSDIPNTITLMAESAFGNTPFYTGSLMFDPNMNVYAGSGLHTAVSEVTERTEFSGREEALIIARDLPDVSITTVDQKLWPLSVAEANAVSVNTREFSGSWWLRSQGAYGVRFSAYVDRTGAVSPNGGDVTSDFLVRPAFCLDVSSVLFTSATDGKSGDVGSLYAAETPSGVIKLTAEDNVNMDLDVTSSAALTAKQGETVSIDYTASRASMLGDFYVSCVIENSSGMQYYGKLVQMPSYGESSGTATIQLPADMPTGAYTLRLFYEQIMENSQTDFASTPVDINLTVESRLIKLDTPGSLAWDAATPSKATWSAVPGAGSYTVRLYRNGTFIVSKTATAANYDFASYITETGMYTFNVRARGDGITYSDSSYSATSPAYAYTAPPTKLTTPGSLAWSAATPAKATWGAVPGASSYTVQLYKNSTACGSVKTGITTASYDFTSEITETGEYTFTVTAIGDGTVYSDSDPSAPGAAYNYTAPYINNPPAAKADIPAQNMMEGKSTSFYASDIAQDADGDTLIITAITAAPASADS